MSTRRPHRHRTLVRAVADLERRTARLVDDVGALEHHPRRTGRALADLHRWIASGFATLPHENEVPAVGHVVRSRVRLMADAGADLLCNIVLEPLLAAGVRDPAALDFAALRAAWRRQEHHHHGPALPAPDMFGGGPDELAQRREQERQRPARMPRAWADFARRVDRLRDAHPRALGDPGPAPPSPFLV